MNWINVNDQLPETMKLVLGCNKNGALFLVQYTKGEEIEAYDYDEGDFFLSEGWYETCEQFNGEYDEVSFERKITHWMPLPELLKDVSSNL